MANQVTAPINNYFEKVLYENSTFEIPPLQNDKTKKIVSVFYGIQCSLNNLELNVNIMTNSSPDHFYLQNGRTVGWTNPYIMA
jgi:hypothetical protein